MSTIIDALKKTQSALDNKPYPDHRLFGDIEIPNTDARNQASLLKNTKKKKKKSISFLNKHFFKRLVIASVLGSISWLGYHYQHQISAKLQTLHTMLTEQKKQPIKTTPPPTLPTKKPHTNLSLNGTIHVGNKRDALINNQLLKVGDTIDDYQVSQVHYNSVTLLNPQTKRSKILTTSLN